MQRNPWLSIDVTTAPAVRAQELRHAWERFVSRLDGDGDPDGGDESELVRDAISASWRRSAAAGVDPEGHRLAPVVGDLDDNSQRWEEHPLAAMAPLIRECLATIADEAGYLIVVSDAAGVLLQIEGDPRIRLRAADSMNFAEGTLWSEPGAGTNAIGTALAVDHAVQVFAAEHFNEVVQRWTCSAAPIHDPDTGRMLGVIDLTGDLSTVHPHSLSVAAATATAVEATLRCAMQERDDRLKARYADLALEGSGARALVTATGRVVAANRAGWPGAGRLAMPTGGGELILPTGEPAVAEPVGPAADMLLLRTTATAGAPAIAAHEGRALLRLELLGDEPAVLDAGGAPTPLRRRHAEILAILCAHPAGMSADTLCADLHGDLGTPSSVRVEVSRMRKLLGPWVDTQRYRLRCDVHSDVRRVEALLRAGAVRQAAELYPSPLLPASEAPGVIAERDRLDGWLRHSVMTAEDPEALWAWVQSTSGEEDIPAWKRLIAHLELHDPRRSLAASRLGALRRAYRPVKPVVAPG